MDGIPRTEGEYPRASRKALRSLDPAKRFDRKVALARILLGSADVSSTPIFPTIRLRTPFFLSTIPILLCLLVGLALYVMECLLQKLCIESLSNSWSPEILAGLPCLHLHCVSTIFMMKSLLRLGAIAASE